MRFQRSGVQRCLMLLLLRGATHGDVVGESHQVGQKHEERGVVTLTAASFFIHKSRGLSSLTCFFQEPSQRVFALSFLGQGHFEPYCSCVHTCMLLFCVMYAVNISWKHTLWVIPLHAVSYLALTYTRLKQFHDIPDIHYNSCEVLLCPSKFMQTIFQSFCLCFC